MQYLKVKESTTLAAVAKIVGQRNLDPLLAANNLKRSPNIGAQYRQQCNKIANEEKDTTAQRKATILNTMTGEAEVFENAALLAGKGWKVLSALGSFPDALRIPESIVLPNSMNVLGGTNTPISTAIYKKVMDSLKQGNEIDTSIFSTYSTMKPVVKGKTNSSTQPSDMFNAFNLPWGKIRLYSSLADDTIDFPVYPEEVADNYRSNFITMPDTIYQYEPWYLYDSSGPRAIELTFHMHRDMWSGDHRDGKCNQLIRFCQAAEYPKFQGSAVQTSQSTLYINGSVFISGIINNVDVKWSGPIGLDGWYLECELTISFIEQALKPRNFDTIRSMNVIGE